MKTVLGSCVAITIRARRLGCGGHVALPAAGSWRSGRLIARSEALRYVDTTIDVMLAGFIRRGAAPHELEIKLFGGADTFNRSGSKPGYGVGSRNVETALGDSGRLWH